MENKDDRIVNTIRRVVMAIRHTILTAIKYLRWCLLTIGTCVHYVLGDEPTIDDLINIVIMAENETEDTTEEEITDETPTEDQTENKNEEEEKVDTGIGIIIEEEETEKNIKTKKRYRRHNRSNKIKKETENDTNKEGNKEQSVKRGQDNEPVDNTININKTDKETDINEIVYRDMVLRAAATRLYNISGKSRSGKMNITITANKRMRKTENNDEIVYRDANVDVSIGTNRSINGRAIILPYHCSKYEKEDNKRWIYIQASCLQIKIDAKKETIASLLQSMMTYIYRNTDTETAIVEQLIIKNICIQREPDILVVMILDNGAYDIKHCIFERLTKNKAKETMCRLIVKKNNITEYITSGTLFRILMKFWMVVARHDITNNEAEAWILQKLF